MALHSEKCIGTHAPYLLLETYAPDVLQGVRRQFPTYQAKFSPVGEVLGGALIRVDALGCVVALEVAMKLCENASRTAAQRISRSRVISLVGSICTAVSSAAIFTVVAADAPKRAAYAAAILAVAGSVSTIIANYFAQGRGGEVQQAFKDLAEASFPLMRVHCQLSSRLHLKEWDEKVETDVETIIGAAHELCDRVQRAAAVVDLSALGVAQQAEITSVLPFETDIVGRENRSGRVKLIPEDPTA